MTYWILVALGYVIYFTYGAIMPEEPKEEVYVPPASSSSPAYSTGDPKCDRLKAQARPEIIGLSFKWVQGCLKAFRLKGQTETKEGIVYTYENRYGSAFIRVRDDLIIDWGIY